MKQSYERKKGERERVTINSLSIINHIDVECSMAINSVNLQFSEIKRKKILMFTLVKFPKSTEYRILKHLVPYS